MIRHLLFAALLVLAPLGALGADLDIVSQYRSGQWHVMEVLLCDEAPSVACPELDLHAGRTGDTSWPGLPHHIAVEVRVNTCTTTATVGNFVGASTSGGTEHTLVGPLELDVGSTSHGSQNPITHRFVRFDITTPGSGGACNDFEVVLRMFYTRVPGG